MVRFLLLSLVGFAAAEAEGEHLSLLQTAAVKSHDLGRAECKAAKAKARGSKAAMKEARAALKAARLAFQAARATYQEDKGAVGDACPEKENKKMKPAKPCSAKGFEESKGYIRVQSAYKKVELIPGSEAHRIGTYVFRGEWLQKTEGERQEEYHHNMCLAIKPEFCGGNTCPDRRGAQMDPTCEKATAPQNTCDPRGRVGGQDGTHFAPFHTEAHYAFCMDPICAQVCAAEENCHSYKTVPAHRFCELYSLSEPQLMPGYGDKTDNYLVPQDGIFCIKK